MAYRLQYSDYPGTAEGPPDPERWVGPQGPPGPQGAQGVPGPPGSLDGGGTMTGPLNWTSTGSTQSRAAQDRTAEVANVRDFGAKGDGTTDDSIAVRAAVAAGGNVYFPPGVYKVTGRSTILPSGTRVFGAGSARSIIQPSSMTSWDAAGGGTEFGYVFCNTNTNTYGTFTRTRTSAAVQTDVGISIEGLGFDFSQQPGWIGNFVFARRMYINDVRADNGQANTAIGYTGFRFIGCDEVLINNIAMRNIVQAVDCWKGCTRVKVSNASVEVATNATNGAAVNFNGVGTQQTQEFASDLQVENVTIWLHNNIAFFLDGMSGGSSTQDCFISNVRIVALDGTANLAVVGRGRGGRVKIRNMTVTAAPGAVFGTGVITLGAYNSSMDYTATNLVATTNGSPLVTVTLPANILELGPGNYLYIDNGAGGAIAGNGLSLYGYYLVTAVSGPVSSTSSGNVVTANVGANATATGTIAASTRVQGQFGCFSDCEVVGVTFDGVGVPAGDIINLGGAGHHVSNVTVTQNYNGFASPQYRSVINLDGTPVHDQTQRAVYVSALVAAPGIGALQGGWTGNNLIQWQPFGPPPVVGATLTDPTFTGTVTTAALHAAGPGTFDGGIAFNQNAPSATDVSKHISLNGGIGINYDGNNVNYIGWGAHLFYCQGSPVGYINSGTLAMPSFTVGVTGAPTITGGAEAPSATQPVGSIYLCTGGAAGSRLYVSAGAGTWAGVAGV